MLMSSKGSLLTFNLLDLFLLLVNLGLNLLLTEGPPVNGWAGGCLLEKLLQAFRRNRGRLLNTALSHLSPSPPLLNKTFSFPFLVLIHLVAVPVSEQTGTATRWIKTRR